MCGSDLLVPYAVSHRQMEGSVSKTRPRRGGGVWGCYGLDWSNKRVGSLKGRLGPCGGDLWWFFKQKCFGFEMDRQYV